MSISGLGGLPFAAMRGTFQPPSFSSLDTNSDGQITLDELKAGAPGGASAQGDKRAERLFKAMDTDGNGSISEDEKAAFDQKLQERRAGMAFLAQQLNGPSDADVFAATDTNGDGSVSFDEFTSDDAAKGVSTDSLKQLFGMIDSNGDGSIDEGESSSFLDAVRSAVADRLGVPPPPDSGAGGPPPAPSASDTGGATTGADLASLAQNAYSTASSGSDLIDLLQSILQKAA